MAVRVKDQVRDCVEQKFDTLHKIADVVTFPLAPIDGAIHGVARGLLNWATDTHPEERNPNKKNTTSSKCLTSPPQPNTYYAPPAPAPTYSPQPPYQCYPPGPGGYGPPTPAPPPPQPYYGRPQQPGPGYPYPPYYYHNTGGHTNTGNGNNSSGQKNDGTLKFANIGSS